MRTRLQSGNNSISVILLLKTRLQNWTVYQQYYWWEYAYKVEQYISNITDENTFTKLNSIFSNITDENTFTKLNSIISNITDENTFTKLNSLSVILLMKTRLQNWTVYQQYYWWEYVYKVEQYISNITVENTFAKLNSIVE